MANMEDYLSWRGDLTLKQSEFNEVDSVILNEIGYVEWGNVIPEINTGESITLKEACKLFFERNNEEDLKEIKSFIWYAPFLMKAAANTRRFENVVFKNYINCIDLEEQTQFCAYTAELEDGTIYIIYKGTDDTLIGWKEDFNMSFIQPVPGQKMAVDYINTVCSGLRKKVRVGGHSKGGNLAVYAAAFAKKSVQNKIKIIYNNDGPGFTKKMIESEQYQKIKPLIYTIVPHHSIVGMLLEHDEEYHVVGSDQISVMQHDAMSWQVLGDRFVIEPEGLSKSSIALNEALTNWINGLEISERKQFVNTFFSILKSNGAENLSEIQSEKFVSVLSSMKAVTKLSKEQRKMMFRIIKELSGEVNHSVGKSIKDGITNLPAIQRLPGIS